MSTKPIAFARLPPLTGLNGRMQGDTKKLESLSGPTYLLKNDRYALPPAKSLKPYIDMEAGTIATWPAHASGHATGTTSIQLSKNKSLIVLDDQDMGKPQIIPKPRFLEQLETFLNKELRALGVTTVQPNELRLQAHREVFEYLIEDFKTYKPLLAAIKNEYEMMLALQRQQIRELEPLKQLLVTVSEQCDQKIILIREQEKQEMVDLKSENKKLYRRIEELHNVQRDLKEQVNRLQEELQIEYHKYRDECDARKLLVSDINDLRYHQEDYMASKQKAEEDEEEPADPVILKIALKNARDAEKTTSQALNEMVANYCDVIPRRDFESMEKNFTELNEKYSTLQNDFDTLHTEHEALLDVNKQVLQQRDDFYLECETLRQNATPRPDWPKCADHIQGGLTRWTEVSAAKTSNELVDVLLQEMASGGVVDGAPEYFEGKGTGDDVPQYLRYDGQVRNRQMSKRDCTLLIRDIWKEKTAQDAERTDGKYERMENFVHGYLKGNFPLEQMTIEWAYNLNDACKRFAHDDVIGLFAGVLAEEIDEELYHGQLHTIGSIMEHMDKVKAETGGDSEKFTKDGFLQSLQEYFTKFSEQSMLGLLRAAETELEAKDTDEIEYKNLFMEDDEGRTGPFLNEVKRLINEQRATFAKEITEQLGDTSPASVDDLKRAITMTDPEVDQSHLDLYLSWVYQTTPESYNSAQPLEKTVIEERLKNGNIQRLGKQS